jgi:hypothetical protein
MALALAMALAMAMARHKPRSHLRLTNGLAACGRITHDLLSRHKFKRSENRCQHCDRIASGLSSAGGRPKKDTVRYSIVLTGLTPEALQWVEQRAIEGKAGVEVGAILNRFVVEKVNENWRSC